MIESIKLSNIATYKKPQYLNELSQFNFVFGGNGSGKTTITRVIADESRFPSCSITWKDGIPLQTLVYNRHFVVKNFNQSDEIKGIFTLGSQNILIKQEIRDKKLVLAKIQHDINSTIIQLNGDGKKIGIVAELARLEETFKDICWSICTKYKSTTLVHAFQGVKGRKEVFKKNVLCVSQSKELYPKPVNLALLQEQMGVVFGKNLMLENLIPDFELETINLIRCESDAILKKRVLGKNNVDIAAMIQRLGNSDWIKVGREFYEQSDHKTCPFCQQYTTEQFTKNLNEYFDDVYNSDIKTIDELISNYQINSSKLQQILEDIVNFPSQYLDISALKNQKQFLDTCLMLNRQRLFAKKQEPSQLIELESIVTILSKIKDLINFANTQVAEHNKLIKNLSVEKSNLSAQVWTYIVNVELQTELAEYRKKKAHLSYTIANLTQLIHEHESQKSKILAEIANLEKQTCSVQPTIETMNNILSSSGFQGFSFMQAEDDIAAYKLVRPEGMDAKKTLSEGEKTFISFLYFYCLIKGSHSETGVVENRVVVFDDPVSSLDSDILFIVSSLIKRIFDEVRNQIGYIKQLFVFTHNIQFHRDVTFNTKRSPNNILKKETFWIVRKSDSVTKLDKYSFNPIKTSYDLLWSEIRDNKYSRFTIQNMLRRILEHYFKLLGEIDFHKICDLFEGADKATCGSLISGLYDGSNSIHDECYVLSKDSSFTSDTYLRVFKAIFEKSGHIKHYEIMMKTHQEV